MPAPPTADALNAQFGRPQTLRFEDGAGGLVRAVITTDAATAVLYLHGAHLTEYQPTGQKPVLFTSRQSDYHPDKPIRGGVPICFPWFGPNRNDPAAPSHGLARLQQWTLAAVDPLDRDHLRLTLTSQIEPYRLTYLVTVGPQLDLRLRVHHAGRGEPARFEQAMHTYLAIGQIRHVDITGLEGMTYLDKTQAPGRFQQGSEPVRFDGETDRVYVNHPAACTLTDPDLGRRIVVEKENANSTIVWNPWTAKSQRLPDLGDEEWPGFVCIESGNVGDNAVTLAPGETHEMATTVHAQPL